MQSRSSGRTGIVLILTILGMTLATCAKPPAPVTEPAPPLPPEPASLPPSPPPPEPVARQAPLVPPDPIPEDTLGARSLDELNRDSPLEAVFFSYDSSAVTAEGQTVLTANAELMKRYPSWVVTIEGHCDERGTAEYNLALGERRALAARDYLLELGLAATRVRTVSYGKEFPFDPGHHEAAWARNRRAHFVITAK